MTNNWALHALGHLLSILSFLFAIILFSRILSAKKASDSTLAWLIGMLTLPYLVIPLYLLIGDRKIKRISKEKGKLQFTTQNLSFSEEVPGVERILLSSGISKKTQNNEIDFLFSGEEAFKTILDSINSAEHSIHLVTFILGNDAVATTILTALEAKAKKGIQIQLLLDGVGSFWFPSSRLAPLRAAGGQVSIFLPFFRFPFPGWSNLRNHRKMILIDQRSAIVGGMNLSQNYIGPTPNSERWTDLNVFIRGQAIAELEDLFQMDWKYASKEQSNLIKHETHYPSSAGPVGIQIIPSGPDVPEDTLYDLLLTAIFSAKKRIWIVTPYFIPDQALAKALELACRRRIDVRILVPKKSNHFLADLCRKSYLRQISNEGGRLYFFGPNMMHAKVFLVDEEFALIGSANFDMRSLFLNYEVGVLISSKNAIEPINTWFHSLEKKSQNEKLSELFGFNLIEGIGRVLGPLL